MKDQEHQRSRAVVSDPVAAQVRSVQVPIDHILIPGDLSIPIYARGVVAFAHGSGSSHRSPPSHRSPRNRYVARVLNQVGLATLLFDLLTREEEYSDNRTGELRFNIRFLAARLAQATNWLVQQPKIEKLKLGYFGASTGAAAALLAAADIHHHIGAVVSRGGWPDLAKVQAPTLLIVGSEDKFVIGMNRQAMDQLRCEKRLDIVPGARHLFEEPDTLEQVARLTCDWFAIHLGKQCEETWAA